MLEHEQEPAADDLSKTLGASLNSVWNRYADSAPAEAAVEVDPGVVRWSFQTDHRDALKDGLASRNGNDGRPARTMASFERETADVVAKAMHRKVTARFSKKPKDGLATEVFVLEAVPRKN